MEMGEKLYILLETSWLSLFLMIKEICIFLAAIMPQPSQIKFNQIISKSLFNRRASVR